MVSVRSISTTFYVNVILPESTPWSRKADFQSAPNGSHKTQIAKCNNPPENHTTTWKISFSNTKLNFFFASVLTHTHTQMKIIISQLQQYNRFFLLLLSTSLIMFTATRSTTAFLSRAVVATTQSHRRAAYLAPLRHSAKAESMSSATTPNSAAATNQAEVVLVGCGAPNRGMGWYHAVQMLDKKYVLMYMWLESNLCENKSIQF